MKKSQLLTLITTLLLLLGSFWVASSSQSKAELSPTDVWTPEILPELKEEKVSFVADCNQTATTADCINLTQKEEIKMLEINREPPLLAAGVIDEHLTINNELAEVNFCGNTYQARQVLIDGVNVVERIGEILEKKDRDVPLEHRWCVDVESKKFIRIEHVSVYEIGNTSYGTDFVNVDSFAYSVRVEGYMFDVVPSVNHINHISGYDGSIIGPSEQLK